ncbi:Na+/H+ antiporter NhaA [Peterkaempfera griseoplana]|uniref:Na+/H+ antiporter NhaA n=1 Tax=Peterkaempfera griseoplana TaxID=66896 RepID=UPI0006E4635F|nr:Na+/H+ antiporter NhaA [Peterkaempfera griseoplana]
MSGTPRRLFGRLSLRERTVVLDALRTETVGGVLLLAAAALALIWANVRPQQYEDLVHRTVGPPGPLRLEMSLHTWATEGLLTVFFFVAGIELKRELVAGDLRDRRAAALPVAAAVCGMAVPALVYTAVNLTGGGRPIGWAIPMATDIAFALGVLAVVGSHLPSPLRAFLLTLAVVDDLGAILVIAVFYTSRIDYPALLASLAGLGLFLLLQRLRVHGWYVHVPLALAIWVMMHLSGVHATVAGVAMGLMLRCTSDEGETGSPAERVEHLVRPFSAGVAVPLFAFFACGVPLSAHTLTQVFTEAAPLGVVLGLVAGKPLGVFGGTWATARFTRAELDPGLQWADVHAVATLAGIGFTVSLLLCELAFPGDPELTALAKEAVLTGSLICALTAGGLLRLRSRHYRRLYEADLAQSAT